MNTFFLFVLALCLLPFTAYATEKTRSALQTDLATYKLREYNAQVLYDRLIDLSDSAVFLTESGDLTITGTIDTSGVTYSTALAGNPLTQTTNQSISSANVEAGYILLTSASGKKPYVGGYSVQSDGAAAGATSIDLVCYESSLNIATIPVAMLPDGVTVGPYSSAPSGTDQYTIYTSRGLIGCPAGNSVQIIATGSALSGTTNVNVKLDYTWQ